METYLDIAALPDVIWPVTTGCGVNAETYSELAITTAVMLKECRSEGKQREIICDKTRGNRLELQKKATGRIGYSY